MRSLLLRRPGPAEERPLELAEVEPPTPVGDELLIRVVACGVCRSNLHMVEGEWAFRGVPAFLPITPGHEVVGRVVAVGERVDRFSVGDRVGIGPIWSSCGRCEYCLTGRDQLCMSKVVTGETVNGGYADYMLARQDHTFWVPEGIGDVEAAPLFCPGLTAFGALAKAGVSPGKRVAVFGIGGIGHVAVQLARLWGADVVAVSRSNVHLTLAEELGATEVIRLGEEDGSGRSVDASVVFAPSDTAARQAVAMTKPGGVIVVGIDASAGMVPFYLEKVVMGSILGGRQQMRDLLGLAADGKVRVECEEYPLEEGNEALVALKEGRVRGRAVLVAGGAR